MRGHETQAHDILLKIQEINLSMFESLGEEFKRNSCLLIEYYQDLTNKNFYLSNFDQVLKVHNECIHEILNLGMQSSFIYVKEKFIFFINKLGLENQILDEDIRQVKALCD